MVVCLKAHIIFRIRFSGHTTREGRKHINVKCHPEHLPVSTSLCNPSGWSALQSHQNRNFGFFYFSRIGSKEHGGETPETGADDTGTLALTVNWLWSFPSVGSRPLQSLVPRHTHCQLHNGCRGVGSLTEEV